VSIELTKSSWRAMVRRCHKAKSGKEFRMYRDNGISVHSDWLDFNVFLHEVGPRPSPLHSLDRYPNANGNYEPGNVRWATYKQQARNMRSNRLIEYSGQRLTLAEWSERTGINYNTLHSRLSSGWSADRMFSESVHVNRVAYSRRGFAAC
jgi:hypothetical protein